MSKTKVAVVVLAVLGLILSFGAGYAFGSESGATGLGKVKEAWDVIFSDYVEKDSLDAAVLGDGAVKGMLDALDDPYSAYLDASTYQLSLTGIQGRFEGIGARVTLKDKQLIVVTPLAGSPAEMAGIRSGDIILEVNGEPVSGLSLEEAVLKIRGPKGTSVGLSVLHEGAAEPVEIEITRAEVEVPSVEFERRGDIAYIRISEFSEHTSEELLPIFRTEIQGTTGIVLDLRNNLGGLLQEVVDVSGYFLPGGVAVRMVDNDDRESELSIKPNPLATNLPMVVLVNGFTASGGEVLSGALQDYGRALIAGQKTFGKGSVDILRQLQDGSALYITTARWLTPYGRPIEGEGITPDHELELEGEDAINWAIDYLKQN